MFVFSLWFWCFDVCPLALSMAVLRLAGGRLVLPVSIGLFVMHVVVVLFSFALPV
jgi:hypothetical protein